MGIVRACVDLCVAAPDSGPIATRRLLLLGTSFLVYRRRRELLRQAQNECGVAPPGGGTVTCPAGLYPDGITYDVVDDLTVVLQPGVETQDTVSIHSDRRPPDRGPDRHAHPGDRQPGRGGNRRHGLRRRRRRRDHRRWHGSIGRRACPGELWDGGRLRDRDDVGDTGLGIGAINLGSPDLEGIAVSVTGNSVTRRCGRITPAASWPRAAAGRSWSAAARS